jgi:PAS domain-containing protein
MSVPFSACSESEQTKASSESLGDITLIRAITEHIPGSAVFVLDTDFRYLFAGGEGLHNTGMTASDFEGKYLASVVPAELLNQYLADYTAIFEGRVFVREHSVGSRFYRTRGRLIKGTGSRRDLALAISYDITGEHQVANSGMSN